MARLIDANVVLDRLKSNIILGTTEQAFLRNYVNSCPTIDAVPVVHGRWIESKLEVGGWCSECDHYYEWWETSDANYCPHRGAKMDK